MEEHVYNAILFTIITTLLITTGQVLWKIGLNSIGGLYIKEYSIFANFLRIISSLYFWLGIGIYIIATGFFMYLLSKYELSLIIPIGSIAFIFSLIAGIIFFQEEVNIYRWLGVIVIIIGVFLISKS